MAHYTASQFLFACIGRFDANPVQTIVICQTKKKKPTRSIFSTPNSQSAAAGRRRRQSADPARVATHCFFAVAFMGRWCFFQPQHACNGFSLLCQESQDYFFFLLKWFVIVGKDGCFWPFVETGDWIFFFFFAKKKNGAGQGAIHCL